MLGMPHSDCQYFLRKGVDIRAAAALYVLPDVHINQGRGSKVTTSRPLPRVHIATEHAGTELSAHPVQHLGGRGYDVVDHGPKEYAALDDYPPFCINLAQAVV